MLIALTKFLALKRERRPRLSKSQKVVLFWKNFDRKLAKALITKC